MNTRYDIKHKSFFVTLCVQQLKNHRAYECIIVDFRSATSTEDVDIILLSCGWLIAATYYLSNNMSHWFSIQGRGGYYGELESRSRSPQSGQDLDCHTLFKASTTITLSSHTLLVMLMSMRNVAGSFFWYFLDESYFNISHAFYTGQILRCAYV